MNPTTFSRLLLGILLSLALFFVSLSALYSQGATLVGAWQSAGLTARTVWEFTPQGTVYRQTPEGFEAQAYRCEGQQITIGGADRYQILQQRDSTLALLTQTGDTLSFSSTPTPPYEFGFLARQVAPAPAGGLRFDGIYRHEYPDGRRSLNFRFYPDSTLVYFFTKNKNPEDDPEVFCQQMNRRASRPVPFFRYWNQITAALPYQDGRSISCLFTQMEAFLKAEIMLYDQQNGLLDAKQTLFAFYPLDGLPV